MKPDPIEALSRYDDELKRWRVEPLCTSEWNDNGRLRYRQYVVERLPEEPTSFDDPVPLTATIEHFILDDGYAQQFPRIRAMEAALAMGANQ